MIQIAVYDSDFGTRVIISGGKIVSVLDVQNDESSRYYKSRKLVSISWIICKMDLEMDLAFLDKLLVN
jgi:hypothetical protein